MHLLQVVEAVEGAADRLHRSIESVLGRLQPHG
jgi:hypothetical protein